MSAPSRSVVALVSLAAGAGLFWAGEQIAARASAGDAPMASAASARTYLLAHPEMIPEVIDTLRQRDAVQVIAANRHDIFTPVGNAWAGNPKGDLTIVEYFDYNCGYCRASLPIIKQLLADDPKLRIVFREWPILTAESGDAAKLSLAAATQGKFAAFHDALYAGGPVTPDSMAKAAQTAGVDPHRAAPGADEELARNMRIAHDLGMSGTPSWVIGNRAISAAMPLEQMKTYIAEARGGK